MLQKCGAPFRNPPVEPLRNRRARGDFGTGAYQGNFFFPIGALFAFASIFLLLIGCGQTAEKPAPKPELDIASLLGGADGADYARAEAVREFIFPQDHGPHPEFHAEWWYFTGNLRDEAGRRYGFQLTFFRLAMNPEAPDRDSAWATNQAYMAHFALTDVEERTFHSSERFSRGAVGLAGARSDPFKVWLETWQVHGQASDSYAGEGMPCLETFPWQLQTEEGGITLSLTVGPLKGIVLQGDQGLSRKGPEPGNASYYYSITRLWAGGTLTLGGEEHTVSGTAWFDHEWSTSALGENLAGWDWFALQFGDGTDLMYYRLRQRDGTSAPYSEGTLVNPAGDTVRLQGGEVTIKPLAAWRSPQSGTEYPVKWRVHIPLLGRDFIVCAVMSGQEQDLSVRYWEGAVEILDEWERESLGWGYVELTGYARP